MPQSSTAAHSLLLFQVDVTLSPRFGKQIRSYKVSLSLSNGPILELAWSVIMMDNGSRHNYNMIARLLQSTDNEIIIKLNERVFIISST